MTSDATNAPRQRPSERGTPTRFATGEVQKPDELMSRHAVALAAPEQWGVSVCSARKRVWVHAVGGEAVPFPGAMGEEMACPECASIVKAALPSPIKLPLGRKPSWPSLRRLRKRP